MLATAFMLLALSVVPTLHVEVHPTDSGSFPRGAQRIEMMSMTLKAQCGSDIPITSITLTHQGLGALSDIENVYLMEGNRRVSGTHTFNSREPTLRIPLRGFEIPDCESREVRVMIDSSPDAAAGAEHALAVASSNDIETPSAEVSLLSASVKPRRSTPASIGTIDVEYLDLRGPVRFGSNRMVGRFQLTADKEGDHTIVAITFTNTGKATDRDLQNLVLENNRGQKMSVKAESLDGDKVRLMLDPSLRLGKNEMKTLVLKADIRASRKKTIQFVIEEPSDIETK